MDISCPSCGEPFDFHHMRFDEPYEWGLTPSAVRQFIQRGSRFAGAADPVRKAAEAAGWRFASDSVLSFIACPGCKGGLVLADACERRLKAAAVASILGDDDDGLAADLSLDR